MKNILKVLVLFTLIHSYLFSQSGWQIIPSGTTAQLKSIHYVNPFDLYICGDALMNLKSTDNGLTWQTTTFSSSVTLNDIFVINQNTVVTVGNSGTIMRTTDAGNSWNIISSGISEDLNSLCFVGNYGICCGLLQTILYSTDAGASWNIATTGYLGVFWSAYMLSPQIGFVAGENSIFQPLLGRTTDSGLNWDYVPFYLNNNEGYATGVDFTDLNIGYTTARVWDGRGAVSKTTDTGNSWVTTFFGHPLWSLDFPISGASLIGYAVGDLGVILKTVDAGVSWQQQVSGTTLKLNKVYFIDSLEGYVVGENGIVLRTTDGGIPVELKSFTATVNERDVILNWITATEINNRGFEVEKLFGKEWVVIGFVEGNGTTTEPKSYSFRHEDLEAGIHKYRLKQIDYDGTFEYSENVEAKVTAPVGFELSQNYPNPFNPSTKIKFTIPAVETRHASSLQMVTLKVYDVLGNEIATLVNEEKPAGEYEVTFDRTGLPSGIYFYQLQIGDPETSSGQTSIQTKKMVLMK